MRPQPLAHSDPKLHGSYQPRTVRFLRSVGLDDWVVKLYGIAPHARPVRATVVEAALRAAERVLPSPAISSDRYGANPNGPHLDGYLAQEHHDEV